MSRAQVTGWLTACAFSIPAATAGQSPTTYARDPRDTLWYRELTNVETWATYLGDSERVSTVHDATIGVSFSAGDTARAWYEDLVVEQVNWFERRQPGTAEVLRLPFTLCFDARGHVSTLAAPAFPTSIAGITDLTKEFWDFFPVLPRALLRVGATWVDTLVRSDSGARGSHRLRAITSYRVTGERSYYADSVWVLIGKRATEITVRQDAPKLETRLAGASELRIYFSQTGLRMSGKREIGALRGALMISAGQHTQSFPRSLTYVTNVLPLTAREVRSRPRAAAPARVEDSFEEREKITLDERIRRVTSGGSWRSESLAGGFRIIEAMEGWEEVRHRVIVEWVSVPEDREDSVISRYVDLATVAGRWFSLYEPEVTSRDGKTYLTVQAMNAPMGPEKGTLTFELGAPGEIKPVKTP